MKNFFRYLTSSEEDKQWGLYLTVAGSYTSPPLTPYPKTDHPTGYHFDWQTGRILNEYQIILITEGSGILQVGLGEYEIKPGTILIIRPGVKHRYKPNPKTGWTENYLGFKGDLADHFMNRVETITNYPILYHCVQYEFFDCYQKIFELVSDQKPSYQKISSGLLLKLLGYISSHKHSEQFAGKQVDQLVNDLKNYMWENVNQNIDLKEFCRAQSVSYSYMRKAFKLYTGISPHQYFLDLKIMRAQELLVSTEKPIKEITYKLGFESIQYFSRLFKLKTGISPSSQRSNHNMSSD